MWNHLDNEVFKITYLVFFMADFSTQILKQIHPSPPSAAYLVGVDVARTMLMD